MNASGCNEKHRSSRRRALMPDLLFMGVLVLFFAASAGCVRVCERLQETPWKR
jgi:hypothetical protein